MYFSDKMIKKNYFFLDFMIILTFFDIFLYFSVFLTYFCLPMSFYYKYSSVSPYILGQSKTLVILIAIEADIPAKQ